MYHPLNQLELHFFSDSTKPNHRRLIVGLAMSTSPSVSSAFTFYENNNFELSLLISGIPSLALRSPEIELDVCHQIAPCFV